VLGRAALQSFVAERARTLSLRGATATFLRTTETAERIAEEWVLSLRDSTGAPVELPVALVGDRAAGEQLIELRIYFVAWPFVGGPRLRPALLADRSPPLRDVMARYQRALHEGALDDVVACFEPDGVFREPSGTHVFRGREALRHNYAGLFAAGGGIPLEHCSATDDGVCCAVEYNVVRWGHAALPPQAGVGVYERGPVTAHAE
jgi:hypothetical protein